MQSTVGLDFVKSAGTERHLRDFQNISRSNRREVPGTVAVTYELATELVNQDISVDASSSADPISMKKSLATAQSQALKRQGQFALLH